MKNSVELIGWYGGDITHAQSAWTSTYRDITEEKKERMPKLLKMLADAGHHTPFEKSTIHFLVNSEIASHVHLLKHRIGTSLNAESARYKELKEDKYYIPEDWEFHYGETRLHGGIDWQEKLIEFNELANKLYHDCLKDLSETLGRKRAKESARFFKPYSSQITADVSFNWRSFHHFLSLRKKPDAQLEIREIAEQMLECVKNIEGNPFKYTLEAFGYE